MTEHLHRPKRVHRVPEGIFGEAVAVVTSQTGVGAKEAERVVDGILGLLHLATRTTWSKEAHPCGHAYLTQEGSWLFCVEQGSHDLHEDDCGETWRGGESRDVDMRAFQES